MKTTLLNRSTCCPMVAGVLALAAIAVAGPVEQVDSTGSGIGGHTTINSAIAAVDSGGVVQIIEAGNYATASLIGGKSYTIEATVPGVVSPGPGVSANWSTDASLGAVDVTLRDFELNRDTGTGQVITIDQDATNTVTVTMDNMVVHQSLAASGGEALKFNVGVAAGAAVSLIATDTSFTADTASGSGKSAIRVQSSGAPVENLFVDLTNCQLTSHNEGCIRSDGGNNQNWTLTDCTITTEDRGIELATVHSNCTFTLTNTTITTTNANTNGEAIIASPFTGSNNTWTITRCTLDNSAATAPNDSCVNIDYNPGTPGTGNSVTVYNSVIKTHTGSAARGILVDAIATPAYHHNTVVAVGGAPGTNRAFSAVNSGAMVFSNNLLVNFSDPWSGSTGTKTNNIVCGPFDEGTGGTYISAADDTAAIAALVLDGSYIPQTGSPALSAGDSAFVATVGSVDRLNLTRPFPAATLPDIGAFENQSALPVELDSFGVE